MVLGEAQSFEGHVEVIGLGCGRLRFFEIGEDKRGLYVGRLSKGRLVEGLGLDLELEGFDGRWG